MKVLLVDDTLTDRLIVESYLENMGHEVVVGENGQEALQLFRQYDVDLILLDEVMPVMAGHEVAKAIRDIELGKGMDAWVPIIFLSSRASPTDIAKGIESGGDDYLKKPIDEIILNAKMKSMQRISLMRRRLISLTHELADANQALNQLAESDGLTGLSNRRRFDEAIRVELTRAQRQQAPLSMLMIDVDFFKAYNDHYGHLEGDNCLKSIAKILQQNARRVTDIVARYGGEEFVVILPATQLECARYIAERIRLSVQNSRMPHALSVHKVVTASLGLHSIIPDKNTTVEDMIEATDRALYLAKRRGRNQVAISYQDFENEQASGAD